MTPIIRYLSRALLLLLVALAFFGAAPATYAAGTTWYVNPTSGNDTNSGTLLKPFRTLGKALKAAHAGDTIQLAKGTYGKNGGSTGNNETFGAGGLAVPADVTIIGTLAAPGVQGSFISSTSPSENALNFMGNATVRDVELDVFNVALKASSGILTISNVNFILNQTGILLSGTAQATITSSYMYLNTNQAQVRGADINGQAQLIMRGGKIEGTGPNAEPFGNGVRASDAAQVTLKEGAQIVNAPGSAVFAQDSAQVTLNSATMRRSVPTGGTPSPSMQALGSAALTLVNSNLLSSGGVQADGIVTNDFSKLSISGGALSGQSGSAIRALNALNLSVSGTSITQNGKGIEMRDPNASLMLTGATVAFDLIGIIAPKATIRSSTMSHNINGLIVSGPSADLGTLASPGKNTLQQNSLTSIGFSSLGSSAVSAVGNTWNPKVQGTDANGFYTKHFTVTANSPDIEGTNYVMSKLATIQF